jgi:molecular chaperone DnaJ
MPISIVTATLGAEVEVTTIDKQKATLKIHDGTQTGSRFRIKGKGMPYLRGGGVGDLLVDVIVETPIKLSKKQKELLQEFEKSGKESENNPMSSKFFKKIKDFFDF